MTGSARHLRLLITVAVGPSEDEVVLERISVGDEPSPFPDIPALGAALMEEEGQEHLTEWEQFRVRKRLAQCLLMDQFDVPNGDKSIAIALHRYWTPALAAVFGSPNDPSSVRRWRRVRGKARRRHLSETIPRHDACLEAPHDPA